MSEKNELHKLIHSLTPNEKAYFKKFAYKSKDDKENPYLVMFDAILKQDEYDEEALKKKLKNTKLVNNFLPFRKIILSKTSCSLFYNNCLF